ncbi:hypothetical protein LR69_02405 [Geobacillus sp. BCO2]|nr:hypothetical protein LR69_02405 [Geobacillus sp. BCO2]
MNKRLTPKYGLLASAPLLLLTLGTLTGGRNEPKKVLHKVLTDSTGKEPLQICSPTVFITIIVGDAIDRRT